MKRLALIALAVSALVPTAPMVFAQDAPGVVTIEGTRIRGDQEVPTVMYLVPWQPPEVDELRAPEERLMVDQGLRPLERYEFQRFIKYHEAFIKQTQANTGQ
ncbi:hypothetical protein ABWH88_20430 [Marinobacter adhaerens]|jgi:hypothetical protein|uniref:Secreted protein n=2 Tax=Marinobacter adhaerens TaxID=1033846 RepID=A0A352IQ60_9GAMM|nr:hypothetical protein [Marinobacter adhaerens]MCR9189103.1 hypothetical protein [Alteromonadaceae bacterium]ADP97902.1 conserved hypothetical protein, secreted [Marinobacter adhaerens HP15]MBW4977571.1 hypothetical protein [Marinobacter adhaerens]QWV11946.1 hypothetical protein KQ249_14815 [Marinobacter adhaerens]HBC33593.1 hypothetical protein [Marinobacter adhaerens]|tara:strand:- start:854 stop:1159 length:306 start_codon:yes stop_codon:yes gene_type:complete